MRDVIEKRFAEVKPADVDFCSLRWMRGGSERVSVRHGVLQPVVSGEDQGAMVTIINGGGMGYAATSDLSVEGLRRAVGQAREWAGRTAGRSVVDFASLPLAGKTGEYASPVRKPWASMPLPDKVEMLRAECERLKTDARIVDSEATLWSIEGESLILTSDGGRIHQRFNQLVPGLRATANEGAETQTRTFAHMEGGWQAGLEVLDQIGFHEAAPRVAEQALELLGAPDCPSGRMDLILAPDQMVLQIHESIGHPLELDRILGDERNYAGTSFVTLDMIGSYRYGSELLNIAFDPTREGQMASYGFDDDGTPARKEYLIKDGILVRALGGVTSQARAGMQGVANARACSWNRPPIDRMANINLEAGDKSLEQLIGSVEKGVFMETNCSWSIDDSRNKFQFGCEYGRVIENGELKHAVKKPNYRGISATFWRSLKGVGDHTTDRVMGTPFCGKGEPNQVIAVGHASPACLFGDVEVFGGA